MGKAMDVQLCFETVGRLRGGIRIVEDFILGFFVYSSLLHFLNYIPLAFILFCTIVF